MSKEDQNIGVYVSIHTYEFPLTEQVISLRHSRLGVLELVLLMLHHPIRTYNQNWDLEQKASTHEKGNLKHHTRLQTSKAKTLEPFVSLNPEP